MKKIFLLVGTLFLTGLLSAQDQVINGNQIFVGDITIRSEQVPTPFGEWGKKLHFGIENGDALYFSRVNIRKDHSELRLVLGDDSTEKFAIGYKYYLDGLWKEGIVLRANGFVGIKVSDPTCELDVNGRIKSTNIDVTGLIRAKEVKIQLPAEWADFVFDKDYNLPSLSEVEKHIKEKQHLPDIPSEKEVKENGIDLGEMQAKLLQKIEELTLYVIEQDKKIKDLENTLSDK
ncbi:hypothetical protein [Prevotella sp. 10(H)]|uniref:hypothetical protein n=1 Tax=Prevotella sp. 10(H) TaxID=1158294 RepID=UPI0004A720AA|nr:hypothetical protein [Prevotella sp. 10(H)]